MKKYENFSISPIISMCLNTHNSFQFEAFGTAKVCRSISNTQTILFLRQFFGLFVSHQYSYFRQKRSTFLKKGSKKGTKQTNSIFLENTQSQNLCLTYLSKLNRDPIEKKLYLFEDPHCNRGRNGPRISENPTRPFVGRRFDIFLW